MSTMEKKTDDVLNAFEASRILKVQPHAVRFFAREHGLASLEYKRGQQTVQGFRREQVEAWAADNAALLAANRGRGRKTHCNKLTTDPRPDYKMPPPAKPVYVERDGSKAISLTFDRASLPKKGARISIVSTPLKEHDPVERPKHYTMGAIEVIDAIESWALNYHRGNAVKYIARAGRKDPSKEAEDLKKAVWYLQREINLLERGGE
jgi:hypothetical protein